MKLDSEKIIKAYNDDKSLNSIAKEFHTYPTSIRRILEKEGVELRHDVKKAGEFYVEDGEKLIEWAKAQGRLVTKAELTKVLGKTKLSHSYFMKYPELGQYIQPREQKDIQYYSRTLCAWLKQNGILYKPDDRKALGVSVTALLLGAYANIILQIAIKPKCISKKQYSENMLEKKNRAHEKDMCILFLHEEDFKNLNCIRERLDEVKKWR